MLPMRISLNSLPKLLIIDREGVILKHKEPYILRSKEVKLIDGAIKGIALIAKSGVRIAVASNQSPIGRGLVKEEFVVETNQLIQSKLDHYGVAARFYYCPHTPEDACECRKPRPGMLIQAMQDEKVPPENCWMVGDFETDIAAGIAAGCEKSIHVLSGRGKLCKDADETYEDLRDFSRKYGVRV